MAKRAKKRVPLAQIAENFAAVLALPERLAELFRTLIAVDKADWDFCMDMLRQGRAYNTIYISKGKGKPKRVIHAPCEELKKVQKQILHRLLGEVQTHSIRHGGGQKGTSIFTNAKCHRGHADVFGTDIVNAFPSVLRSRVRACLRGPLKYKLRQFYPITFEFSEHGTKSAEQDLSKDGDFLLEALLDLVVYGDRLPASYPGSSLPQGPPTSPRILDIVSFKMDCDLWALAYGASTALQRFVVTVYMDDVSFSSSGSIPEELQKQVLETIRKHGFHPHTNPRKTVYYSPQTGKVPVVTGIMLLPNGHVSLPRNTRKSVRARLHRFNIKEQWEGNEAQVVRGLVGFVRQVYPEKLPSNLVEPVTAAEARLAAMRGGYAVTVVVSGDNGNGSSTDESHSDALVDPDTLDPQEVFYL